MTNNSTDQLSASLEDYLEAIYALSQSEQKVARSRDISEKLDVAKSSVTGALRQLSERGFVNYKPYGYVTLTEKGRFSAKEVVKKHQALKAFFSEILGIDASSAEDAACRAEHALSGEIVGRLIKLDEFLRANKIGSVDLKTLFCQSLKENKGKD